VPLEVAHEAICSTEIWLLFKSAGGTPFALDRRREVRLSHTQTHHLFAEIAEEGINDLIVAFFTARPHYLTYGSWPLVAATTVSETQVAPIAAPPLLPNPIPFKVSFSVPTVDLYPPDAPMPELVLNPHQFSLRTAAEISLLCGGTVVGKDREHQNGKEGQLITCRLGLDAVGRIVNRFTPQGPGIGFEVDDIDIQDIKPDCLEAMLNCIFRQVIGAVLRDVTIPVPTLSAGAFALVLEQGPQIDADEVDVWGKL
jgi:hypothetical protein